MTSQLKQLATIIREIQEKNDISKSTLDLCERDINEVEKRLKNNQMKQDDIQSWRKRNQGKLLQMKDYSLNQSDEFLIEMFVIMMKAVSYAFDGKTPRYHQMVCLWLNVHTNKAILEVKTGEGKTMIVALTALYYALRGKKVDVFTSSETLAMTETGPSSSVRKLLSIFNISLGDNCQNRKQQAQKAYENQVIYGTSHLFQADYLTKIFSGKRNFFKDRQFDQNHVAILDEVDALLIDRMRDSTRLSSPKPLFQCIKTILILIYEIKKHLIQAKTNYCRIDKVKILNEEISLNFNYNLELSDENYDAYIKEEKDQIYRIVKGAFEKKIRFIIPNYLLQGHESYINMMLPLWINSSYQISKYTENIHYTVGNQPKQIIPVDISTGTYQKSTKWMNGVHQFLELKHKVQLSVDTIVTNYESNLIFFRRYEHYLFGMTGTISQSIGKNSKEPSIFEQFLSSTYFAKIYKIPTAKERLLKIQRPRLYANKMQWTQAIYRDAKEISQKRMVLIIFNTIKQAMQFKDNFSQMNQYNLIDLYDHDEYFDSLKKNQNLSNTIIVSTNLGGRGTDIQITNENILKNGGLYVMMTYFAPNWRIQEQAIGRAGRNGQPGSGCFYLNIQQETFKGMKIEENQQVCVKVFQELKAKRKQIQLSNFEKAKLSIKNQEMKKILLDQFCNKYLKDSYAKMQSLNEIIVKKSKCKEQLIEYYETQMECNFAQQQWGIFLKRKIPQRQQGNQEPITATFDDFVRQYNSNRKNNDVNPGFFAQCASALFDISKEKSQALFNQALSKNNKSWVNKYYKMYFNLKRYQGEQLSPGIVQPLIKGLKDVCQIILVDFSLQMAIDSATQMDPAKMQQFSDLRVSYINIMSYLHSIGSSLQKYVVEDERRMKIKISMKINDSNSPSFFLKGLRHMMCDFQMVEIRQEQKEEGGFWAALWSFAKSVFMTVFSVIVSVVAVAGTPVLAICGGDVGQLWNGVGKLWQKTGQCWKDTFRRLSEVAIIGFAMLYNLVDGPGSEQLLRLIQWLYMRPGQSINSVPTISGQSQSSLRLVQITGVGERCKESKQKIMKIRAKFDEKAKEISKNYQDIQINLEQLKKKENKSTDKIKDIQNFAFSEEKTSNPNQNESPKKQIDKKTILTTNLLIQKNIPQKAQSEIDKLKQQHQLLINNVQTVGSSVLQNIQNKFNQSIETTRSLLQKKIDQNKAVQSDVEAFNNDQQYNIEHFNQLNDKFNGYIGKNTKIEKVSDLQSTSTITSQIAFRNIDVQFIKKEVNKIQAPIKNFVEKIEQANQIIQMFNSKQMINEPLLINTGSIKNSQLKKMVSEVQEGYINELEGLLEQKLKKELQQVSKESDKQTDVVAAELLNKMTEIAEICKRPPIKDPSRINQPYFYEKVLSYKCIAQAVKFLNIKSQDELQNILKEIVEDYVVVIFNKSVIYKNKENFFLKCYEKKSQSSQKVINIVKSCLKDIDIKYSDPEGCKFCGNAMISDLIKFIFSDEIGQTAQLMTQRDIKKQYLRTLVIEEILSRGEHLSDVFIKRKNSSEPSLPLHFLPFQLGLHSVQFKQFCDKVNDQIFITHRLIQLNDNAGIKIAIENAIMDIIREQENSIRQDYKQFQQLVNSIKKKPSRR